MVGDFQGCTLHFALCIWLAIAVSLHLVLWISVKKGSVEPGIPASVRPRKEKPFKLHGGWVIFPKDRVIVYCRNLFFFFFFFFFVIRNKLVFIWGDHWCKLITWNNVVGDVKNIFFSPMLCVTMVEKKAIHFELCVWISEEGQLCNHKTDNFSLCSCSNLTAISDD